MMVTFPLATFVAIYGRASSWRNSSDYSVGYSPTLWIILTLLIEDIF